MSTMTDVRFDFSGRTVLVTGGGSGIGREVAAEFAAAGATVVISGRSQTRLDNALQTLPDTVSAVQADVSRRSDVERLISSMIGDHGKIDIVVSNVAGYTTGDITDVDLKTWESLRATNIDGFFHLAQLALPHLADRRQPDSHLQRLRAGR